MIRKTDPEAIRPYLDDASGMTGGHASEVVLPEDAREAAEVLAESAAAGVAVTISGGGTGLAGGRIPAGGRVLATDRLGGVRSIECRAEVGIAVAGAACTLAELDRAAAARGLFLPPDPTEQLAWVGGAVATGASGSRSFHYGPIRRFVRRLTLILADGTIIDAPRGRFIADGSGWITLPGARGELRIPVPPGEPPRVKSATGYARGPALDLVDLVIGSEGTLAVVAEAELLLLARPEKVLAGIVFFPTEEACWGALRDVRGRTYAARGYAGPAPTDLSPDRPPAAAESRRLLARALEYFGADALEFVRLGGKGLPAAARAGLLFEQEHREGDDDAVAEEWLGALAGHGALLDDSWVALGEAERREIREFRHALPAGVNEWLSRHGRRKHGTDMAVPDEALPEMLDRFRRDIAAAGIASATFGHIGDNHLHVNLLPRDEREEVAARDLLGAWVRRAVALGGVVSAEHGIGKVKATLFRETADPAFLAAMRATKTALDPAGILGRGNLFG